MTEGTKPQIWQLWISAPSVLSPGTRVPPRARTFVVTGFYGSPTGTMSLSSTKNYWFIFVVLYCHSSQKLKQSGTRGSYGSLSESIHNFWQFSRDVMTRKYEMSERLLSSTAATDLYVSVTLAKRDQMLGSWATTEFL